MNIWFTSDLHWSHINIAGPTISTWKKGYRDFDSVWDMNKCLLNNLNELIKEEDILYFLGDWSFGGNENVEKYRNLLRVKDIRFILGNHDTKKVNYSNYFTWVKPIWEGKINDRYFVLNHFAQKTWNHMHQKSIHLYGHSHGSLEDSPYELSIDVGVDTCLYGHKKYTPYHYDEICNIMDNYKTFIPKDHHE